MAFEDRLIALNYRPGTSRVLIILFHGAVDQHVRQLPFFQPFFTQAFGAHQLAVADPCLAEDRDLQAAWYLGTAKFALQDVLVRFFKAFIAHHKFERVIYFGASAGGFAALHYSFHQANSLALTVNPQIVLPNYHKSAIASYLGACWPGVSDLSGLAGRVTLDLSELYAERVPNFVCLLNSCGDRYHVFNQTSALISRLPEAGHNRVVYHSDYYGIPGHSGSVPYKSCIPWIKAAVHSPNLYADSLLTKFTQFRTPVAAAANATPSVTANNPFSADDIQIAGALRDWQLSNS